MKMIMHLVTHDSLDLLFNMTSIKCRSIIASDLDFGKLVSADPDDAKGAEMVLKIKRKKKSAKAKSTDDMGKGTWSVCY
ncbi:hypothetical protein EW145_g3233 [Phellinidium pouzarii]|uniref:Uncharacterized protein n=1 Tax=Phellinidium pouzarii TaxID=167371 RepID=A0A4S4L8C9_9AGAM|nr:hypothetical protein EW145_g7392 [Phellinidium pouzarii]THH07657.1 hypothetical protein EW145_g3233 [Phellinidium pouzarii]